MCQMASIDEQILRVTKEIVVKFIESGRISPTGFHETFKSIYLTVQETVKGTEKVTEQEDGKDAWQEHFTPPGKIFSASEFWDQGTLIGSAFNLGVIHN